MNAVLRVLCFVIATEGPGVDREAWLDFAGPAGLSYVLRDAGRLIWSSKTTASARARLRPAGLCKRSGARERRNAGGARRPAEAL